MVCEDGGSCFLSSARNSLQRGELSSRRGGSEVEGSQLYLSTAEALRPDTGKRDVTTHSRRNRRGRVMENQQGKGSGRLLEATGQHPVNTFAFHGSELL